MSVRQKVGRVGFEPTTLGLALPCSIQLSYRPMNDWWSGGDSNPRPAVYKTAALSLSYRPISQRSLTRAVVYAAKLPTAFVSVKGYSRAP